MNGKRVELQGEQTIIKSLSVDLTFQQLLSRATYSTKRKTVCGLLYTSEKASAYLNYLGVNSSLSVNTEG